VSRSPDSRASTVPRWRDFNSSSATTSANRSMARSCTGAGTAGGAVTQSLPTTSCPSTTGAIHAVSPRAGAGPPGTLGPPGATTGIWTTS
jgi:hypothetical protein